MKKFRKAVLTIFSTALVLGIASCANSSDSTSSQDEGEGEKKKAQTYSITVTNGTASSTSAAAGDTVTVTAAEPKEGKTFDKWTISTEDVTFADESSSMTKFTMPERVVSVAATQSFKLGKVSLISFRHALFTFYHCSFIVKDSVKDQGNQFNQFCLDINTLELVIFFCTVNF